MNHCRNRGPEEPEIRFYSSTALPESNNPAVPTVVQSGGSETRVLVVSQQKKNNPVTERLCNLIHPFISTKCTKNSREEGWFSGVSVPWGHRWQPPSWRWASQQTWPTGGPGGWRWPSPSAAGLKQPDVKLPALVSVRADLHRKRVSAVRSPTGSDGQKVMWRKKKASIKWPNISDNLLTFVKTEKKGQK